MSLTPEDISQLESMLAARFELLLTPIADAVLALGQGQALIVRAINELQQGLGSVVQAVGELQRGQASIVSALGELSARVTSLEVDALSRIAKLEARLGILEARLATANDVKS